MPVPLHNQVAVTGSAQPLSPTPQPCVAFTVKAPLANSFTVYVGAVGVTTSNGFPLEPGDSIDYGRSDQAQFPKLQLNVQDIFVVGTSPDRVGWFATP